MAEIEAHTVEGIDWVEPTVDGTHVLLSVRAGGRTLALALPFGGLSALMAGLSTAAGKAQAIRVPGQPHRHTFAADRVEMRAGTEPATTILTFSIPGGMDLHFEASTAELSRLADERRRGTTPRPSAPARLQAADTFEFLTVGGVTLRGVA